MNNEDYILKVNDLKIYFKSDQGDIKAVDGISFNIKKNEVVALVGESGSGKSISALSITKITPKEALFNEGEIFFNGINLLKLNEKDLSKIRGNKIAYIFQEPMISFNPVFTVGKQIQEVIKLHKKNIRNSSFEVQKLLKKVHLPNRLKDSYPHEMSGGQLQRCMIAMALASSPELLIADEPTTALDVTIQYEILILLKELSRTENLSILLITHNFGVVSELAQRVNVMKLGKIVEYGSKSDIINNPKHEYTKRLISAVPRLK